MKMKLTIFLCGILLGTFVSNAQEIIKKSEAVTLPAQAGQTKIISNGQSLIVTSNKSVTLSDGFHAQAGSNVFISISSQNIYPVPPLVNNTNPELNWVLSRTFNEKGDTIRENKAFFDLGGRGLQNQVKSFSTGHVLASQSIYDRFGHQAIQTLSAPINNSGFSYKPDFVRNNSGQTYNLTNFDIGNKLNAPDGVDASQIGSLGWYYSNNNSWDAYVPATSYPYTRMDYLLDGSDAVARASGIGEQLKMGMNRENYGGDFVAYQQLSNYLSIRKKFFNDADMGTVDNTDLVGGVVESVGKDQQGNWAIQFKDKEGKILMTALPGNWLTVNNSINLTTYNEQFIIDGNIGNYSKEISIKGAGKLKVYDNGVLVYNGNINSYNPPATVNASHLLKLMSNKPFSVSYGLVYNASSYDRVCEPCLSKVNTDVSQIGQDFHYFNLTKAGSLVISGGTISLINLISNATETNYTSLAPGMYKAIAISGEPKITYTSGYSDISYSFYNQKGQLVASIAPNGVQQLITKGIATFLSKEQIPFISLFEYDKQGRLVATKSTDAGRTEFIYRKDGSIRFSQNAEQRKAGKFSYTNYDEVNRVLEAGEYIPGNITFEAAKLNSSLLESVSSDGGLIGGTKKDWTRTHYDLKDNSHGLVNYQQDFVNGAISWTENENSKSWYSYDDQGKVVWTIKQLNGLGTKTIDYVYDFLGNVIKLGYQKDSPSESFYHYYTYDADQRLVNVQTSTDGVNKLQQANYQYYLHGPLKRVELADNLQGIDYTYTAQGALKAINNSNSSADPGKDGIQNSFAPDAFGMNLEYFNGDYVRNGSGINSLATGNSRTWYNGNIAAQSWKSQKPSSVVATYGAVVNNPAMFTYDYDDKYQFQNNKYGIPNLSTNSFSETINANRESNLGYDANGNITSLNRSNATGASTASFVYNYQPNTNKLQSVDNYASYSYDDLGQMTSQQKVAGTAFFTSYNVNGKITGIYSDAAKTQLKVSFAYDESGIRIRKTDHIQNITTYYVYDAAGSIMAIYDNTGGGLSEKEVPLYAAGRIGMYKRINNIYQYELSDHLGNVRVVLNQNKINGKVDVVSYSDYYPFGTPLTLANNDYRYGFQGRYAEADKETGWNSFELRMYDPAIGRWLNIDPENEFYSPYLSMGNNPVSTVDPDGGSTEDPPVKTGYGGVLKEVVIQGQRMSPQERLTARGERGITGADLFRYSNGKKDFGAEIYVQNYAAYERVKAAQPDFEGYILNSALLLTGAGEMIEGGAALYGLGRYGFRKLLQRGIIAEVEVGIAAQEGTKLISQFSTSTIDDAVGIVMKDVNKIGHLFDAKHNLGPLVTNLGGQENTVRALLNAANGRLPASGVFNNIPVNVGGQTIFLRGNVINGVPRLGTMFIK